MIKDFFPVKIISRPTETFAEIAAGRTGWAWPLGLYFASTLSSSILLADIPAEFLARASAGLPMPAGKGFLACFTAGLPGGIGFAFFSCALITGFSSLLRSGRLMFRVPLPAAGAAAYAFFFVARLHTRAAGAAGWLAAGAALALTLRAALKERHAWLTLLKAFLSISVFTITADLAGAAAVLAGAPDAYRAAEYFFSFISLVWLIRAAAAITGLSAARAFAAVVPALLGTFAFAFSLLALGLLGPDVFQILLLM
jgi:hypothetical protein